MQTVSIETPRASEYAPFYRRYVDLVAGDDLYGVLRGQADDVRAATAAVGDARSDYRYAPGKWSAAEVLAHVVDTERVFAYRVLRISRGDATPLPGFDQDLFVAGDRAGGRTLSALAGAFERLRASNLDLFDGLDAEMLGRSAEAGGHPVSVRALLFIIAGHVAHHLRILEDRYR